MYVVPKYSSLSVTVMVFWWGGGGGVIFVSHVSQNTLHLLGQVMLFVY